MGNWPYSTDKELTKAGYRFDSRGRCLGPNCRAEIEWWITPRQKRIPLDPGTMQPHWSTCPDADAFH